ncbi:MULTISPECIES: DUF6737 family protein [Spirulina sp. CCY15215]|uniref:DUF6737 family protein n=1 Tax=Spirulina sp. CCY15215 TaxID=2767591 RepID=UPI0019512A8D|nr:DUF6737 family protein [Spirulina major]
MNFWDYKPWWCQPWSILLTGVVAIAGSWLLLRSLWLTAFVTVPILLWWLLFLILVPRMFRESQETKESGNITD